METLFLDAQRKEEMMEANALANGQGIDPQRLRPGDYFASLTEEALACGLLTEDDLARLQAQLPGLLRRMAAEYAGEGCPCRWRPPGKCCVPCNLPLARR